MRPARGFSLVELAMVLLIVGLLLISLMYTLSAASEQRARDETNRRLEQGRELLLSFAQARGRLPCPASLASAGDESPAGGGVCTNFYSGYLPGKALGMQNLDDSGYALDAWNNRIRYAVSNSPAGNFTTAATLKTNGIGTLPGDLVVCGSSAGTTPPSSCGGAASVTNQNVIVAVLWSHGKNWNASSYSGNDEAANNKANPASPPTTNNNGIFVTHDVRPAGGSGGEFDDMMLWIPVGQLYGRMIAAGVLP
jgi:prepilin-type N-terminal cleavage/methylation domain-containing protein